MCVFDEKFLEIWIGDLFSSTRTLKESGRTSKLENWVEWQEAFDALDSVSRKSHQCHLRYIIMHCFEFDMFHYLSCWLLSVAFRKKFISVKFWNFKQFVSFTSFLSINETDFS